MSNTPIQVSYSLEEVLTRIEGKIDDFRQETNQKFQETNQKIDDLQKEVTELKVWEARLEAQLKGDIKTLEEKTSNLAADIKDIKGSQKAQIWTLIGVLSTTVVGAVIRFVITALPGSNP
jgi:hypothetical protein